MLTLDQKGGKNGMATRVENHCASMARGPINEMTSLANASSDLPSQMGKNGTQVENQQACQKVPTMK